MWNTWRFHMHYRIGKVRLLQNGTFAGALQTLTVAKGLEFASLREKDGLRYFRLFSGLYQIGGAQAETLPDGTIQLVFLIATPEFKNKFIWAASVFEAIPKSNIVSIWWRPEE